MKLQPIGDRIVVEPKPKEEVTKSGIYIPDTAQEKNSEGTVVALGQAKEFPVKIGDYILFDQYSGTELTIDDKTFVVVSVKDIIGILKKE
jgi:chaperonin GroES